MTDNKDALWAALLDNRERATRVALARGASRDDVHDVVQEALARVAAMPDVDLGRIGSLVTVVVANLVTDGYRHDTRAARAAPRLATPAEAPGPEEQILDAAEARWLWSRRRVLANQDRRVLELRARGLSVTATATELGVTYKAAETAYTRARARMREVWRATAAIVAAFAAASSRRLRGPGATAALTFATFVVALLPAQDRPSAGPGEAPAPRPADRIAEAADHWGLAPAEEISAGTPPAARRRAADRLPRGRTGPVTKASTGPVRLGDLGAEGVAVQRRADDETLGDTLARCLRAGVDDGPTRIGCRQDPGARQGAGTQYSLPGQMTVGP